jgi:hypothetical protein
MTTINHNNDDYNKDIKPDNSCLPLPEAISCI